MGQRQSAGVALDCAALLEAEGMKLRKGERCPIHGSYYCCGRASPKRDNHVGSRWEKVNDGITRIRDEHADHPDGYRYRYSRAAMRKLLLRKVYEQCDLCSICGETMNDISEIVPDHKNPRGAGGGRRDDRPENIGAAHAICNRNKGSSRL
jgi:hypothetical protein